MVPKVNVLAHLTQFIFLIIRLVPENVVMVAITTCGKSPMKGTGYMEFRENMYYLLCFLLIK